MINYSVIPSATKTQTPWASLKWAVIITFSLLVVMGLGALATIGNRYRNVIIACLSGALLAGFIMIVIVALIIGYKKFSKQNQWTKSFARDNQWEYCDIKRNTGDLVAFPSSLGITPNISKVRCTVSGALHGIPFELAHISYIQSSGMIGRLQNSSRHRLAWVSVLRLNGHPQIYKETNLIYDKDDQYTYIICPLNAYYVDDIKAMFRSFVRE